MKLAILLLLAALPISAIAENKVRFWVQDNATLVLGKTLLIPRGGTEVPGFLGDRLCTFRAYSANAITLPAGTKLNGQLFAWDRVVSTNTFTLERQALTGIQFFPQREQLEILASCSSESLAADPAREIPSLAIFLKKARVVFSLSR